jgi:hypothetical protein
MVMSLWTQSNKHPVSDWQQQRRLCDTEGKSAVQEQKQQCFTMSLSRCGTYDTSLPKRLRSAPLAATTSSGVGSTTPQSLWHSIRRTSSTQKKTTVATVQQAIGLVVRICRLAWCAQVVEESRDDFTSTTDPLNRVFERIPKIRESES